MKNIIFTICALFLSITGRAQINLVLNPSFESYSTCPDNSDEAKYCNYWMSLDSAWNPPDFAHCLGGVPDYNNTCATNFHVRIPSNMFYFQYSRTGNGLMLVQTYHFGSDTFVQSRDYLQGHLSQTLTSGHKYEARFYVSLVNVSYYAMNNIGAYFDDGTIDTTNHPGWTQSQYIPQVVDTSIINDTLNWIKIEGKFLANGTEKLITIGQFSDSAHTSITPSISSGSSLESFYLIDDVSVIDCSSIPFAGHDTVIHMGDSAFLGSHEPLLPYTWYKLGGSTVIDSSGGIWVKPTVTTAYVLKQVLCDVVRFDTVKVWVWPDTPASIVNGQLLIVDVQVYPNPVTEELTVEGAKGCVVTFYDVVGRAVALPMGRGSAYHATKNKEVFDIAALDKGVYIVEIVDRMTGAKVVKKVLKE